MSVRIITGDCLGAMAAMEPDSFDSCVTDPPYHLTSIVKRFSGTAKDREGFAATNPTNCYKSLSSGFMGQKWDGGDVAFRPETWAAVLRVLKPGAHLLAFSGTRTYHRMVCAIEPICVARKPLIGTVAANGLAHGTGALNIDGCRVEGLIESGWAKSGSKESENGSMSGKNYARAPRPDNNLGRWPANICHDGSDEVLACFPDAPGQMADASSSSSSRKTQNVYGAMSRGNGRDGEASADRRYTGDGATNFAALPGARRGDSGSAARFFYCAKTSAAERGDGNNHPTVKPVALMRWLIRLVTPPGGHVLDPFGGSGSTGIAASREQMRATLIELSPEYAAIAQKRIADDLGALFSGDVAAE
jgi:site-specific DNA-methyltransferase (adenine-specific)